MKEVTSILLAFNIVLSSLGLSIGTHYCGGELKDLALFHEATPCVHAQSASHNEDLPPCHRPAGNQEDDDDCCEDDYLSIAALDIESLLQSFEWQSPLPGNFHFVFTESIQAPNLEYHYVAPEYLNYKPPLIKPDIAALFQVFRI